MELVKHETCQQYVARRLSEGWGIVSQRGVHLILSSPDGNILRPVDLRNDVETLRPSAPGDFNPLTPVGNAANWECVDEGGALGDQDGTYVRVFGLGEEQDLYNLPPSAGEGTINFIKVYFCVKRATGTGGATYPVIKSDTTVTVGASQAAGDSYSTKSQQWNTNPAPPGTDAWTWADIDALQIGVKLSIGTGELRCTQVYVEVDYTPEAVGLENKSANMGSKMVAAGLI